LVHTALSFSLSALFGAIYTSPQAQKEAEGDKEFRSSGAGLARTTMDSRFLAAPNNVWYLNHPENVLKMVTLSAWIWIEMEEAS
jgi:hypothetical protein